MGSKNVRLTTPQIVIAVLAAFAISAWLVPQAWDAIRDSENENQSPEMFVTEPESTWHAYDFPNDLDLANCLELEEELLSVTDSVGASMTVIDESSYECRWDAVETACPDCDLRFSLRLHSERSIIDSLRDSYQGKSTLITMSDEFEGFEAGFCAGTISSGGSRAMGVFHCVGVYERLVLEFESTIYIDTEWAGSEEQAAAEIEQRFDELDSEAIEIGTVVLDKLYVTE